MPLRLRVTGPQAQSLGVAAEHVFDESGGTVGRAPSNSWCLPDEQRVVSGSHASIRYGAGSYFIQDTSTNGTTLNAESLLKGAERPLNNGDSLRIGSYEIAVEITAAPGVQSEPFAASPAPPQMGGGPGDIPGPPGAASSLDPLDLFGGQESPAEAQDPLREFDFPSQDAQPDHSGPEAMSFVPPQAVPDPNVPPPPAHSPMHIPDNWDETGFSIPGKHDQPGNRLEPSVSVPEQHGAKTPAASSTSAAMAAAAESGDIAQLLIAAGVQPDSIDSETYATLGKILQVVIQGTLDVLRSRAQIKDEFRAQMTRLKATENNPLKFSVNAQDALINLFGPKNAAYKSPVEAFTECYDDIKAHQIAMIAGMRAAYEAMLEQFDPNDLEQGFQQVVKRGVLGGGRNKAKYWKLYEEHYKSLAHDPEASFHKLFGDEFARAYEEQMQRLSPGNN